MNRVLIKYFYNIESNIVLIVRCWKSVETLCRLELRSGTLFLISIQILLFVRYYWVSTISCFFVCHCWCFKRYVLFYVLSCIDLNLACAFAISSSIRNDAAYSSVYLFLCMEIASSWRFTNRTYPSMALSLVDSLDDLELDDLDDYLELVDLKHDKSDFSLLSVSRLLLLTSYGICA